MKNAHSPGAFDELNALSRSEIPWQLEIDPNDSTLGEIIAPQFERASLVQTQLQKLDLLIQR
jgi:hypothetical protein